MEGYIKLSRKFFDNPLWTEPRKYSRAEAWIDLIQSAKFEAQSIILNGRVIEVQRGEVVASRRYLEIRWKWSNTKVDNFIKLLVDQGMITTRNATQNTILTLSNFNTYNDVNATKNATRTPGERHPNATRTPNIKKDNKDKKVNNNPPISPKGEVVVTEFYKIPSDFVDLWHSFKAKRNSLERDYASFVKKAYNLEINYPKLIGLAQKCSDDIYFQTWLNSVLPKKSSAKKEVVFDLSFVPEHWGQIMDDWLEYRRGIKKPYKTQQGVEQFYNQLITLSDNNGVEARKIINKAIANEWQGIGDYCKDKSAYVKPNQHSADTKCIGDSEKRSDTF